MDLGDILYGQGWGRWMPASGVVLLGQVAAASAIFPVTFGELAPRVVYGGRDAEDRGWAADAWEPVEVHTEQSLARFREKFGEDEEDRGKDAATINAEEAAHREQIRARLDEAAAQVGVGPLVTVKDVFDFLNACQVILQHTDGDVARYSLNPVPPLPGEVFDLTAEEQTEEDELRWSELYEEPSYRVIELFEPQGARHKVLTSSLEKLSKKIQRDPETVRQAILWLIKQGDFSVNLDVTRLDTYKVFQLRVDWEQFAKDRIMVRFSSPG